MIETAGKTIKTHSRPPSPSRNSAARWVAAIFVLSVSTGHPAATPQCVTVGIDTDCQGTNFIFTAAYPWGTFDPNNICTNWIADEGQSPIPGNPTPFSFNIEDGQTHSCWWQAKLPQAQVVPLIR